MSPALAVAAIAGGVIGYFLGVKVRRWERIARGEEDAPPGWAIPPED